MTPKCPLKCQPLHIPECARETAHNADAGLMRASLSRTARATTSEIPTPPPVTSAATKLSKSYFWPRDFLISIYRALAHFFPFATEELVQCFNQSAPAEGSWSRNKM